MFAQGLGITAHGFAALLHGKPAPHAIVEGAALTVTKIITGAVPSASWQYTLSGGDPAGPGSFTLPAVGGSTVITNLIPTTYTITETVQAGFTSVVTP